MAAELSQQETDNGLLAQGLEQVAENVGARPEVALADTGYSDEGTFEWLEETGQEALLPPQEQPQQAKRNDLFASKCFLPEAEREVLICPAGRELTFRRVVKCSSGHYRVYTAGDCRDCSFYAECVRPQSKRARSVQISVVAGPREKMRQRLKTAAGKALYRLRQQTVEPVFGNLKANLRLSRFGLGGRTGAGAELWLGCMAHNLLIYLRKAGFATGRLAASLLGHAVSQVTRGFRPILSPTSSVRTLKPSHFCNALQAPALHKWGIPQRGSSTSHLDPTPCGATARISVGATRRVANDP